VPRQPASDAIQEGRAKNAVARLFVESLIVPKVYFNARWPNRESLVDVLAVNRSGAGDIYVAEIALTNTAAWDRIGKLHATPAHFKYLALFDISAFFNEEYQDPRLYAEDGLGRIGLVSLYEENGSALRAKTKLEPERFRVVGDIFQRVDKFLKAHEPDILIRV
jgi:hypothetical protein